MAQLQMEFRGMCMHLNASENPSLPEGVLHRVVAIAADQGAVCTLGGKRRELPPHHTFLEMDDEEIANVVAGPEFERVAPAALVMQGVRITLANPAPSALSEPLRVTLDLPCLTDYSPGMVLQPDLAASTVPAGADCVVDIRHGRVESRIFPMGGLYAVWTVETDGDPELVLQKSNQKRRVTVRSGRPGPVWLCVRNGTPDLCNEEYDFALYYLAAVGGIDAQKFVLPLPGEPSTLVDTTTSCSNSTYP